MSLDLSSLADDPRLAESGEVVIPLALLSHFEDYLTELETKVKYYSEIYGNKERALALVEELQKIAKAMRRAAR